MSQFNERLKEFARCHLKYEIQMFYDTQFLLHTVVVQKQPSLKNAVIESFGVHMRLLLHFLARTTSKYADDVFAVHYFEHPDQWSISHRLSKSEVDDLVQRVDKEIAHLSTTRLQKTDETKSWKDDMLKAFDMVDSALVVFFESVSVDKIGESLLASWRELESTRTEVRRLLTSTAIKRS